MTKVADAFGRADAALVLVVSSAAASLFAYLLYPASRARHDPPENAYFAGVNSLFGAVMILLAAWTLSSTLSDLEAGKALSGLLLDAVPVFWLPCIVFFAGALISFTTGTSWGTMGLLMPLAIPVFFDLAEAAQLAPDASAGLLAAIVGAVFSGAVFGDHCSPLSDTTLVSSIACDLEPRDHVRTQLPYAMLAALTALGLGFIPAGFGLSPWILLPAGTLLIILMPYLLAPKESG